MDLDSVILENGPQGTWVRFAQPLERIVAHAPHEVAPALERIAEHTRGGRWAAGYLTYEAAAGLDPAFATQPPRPGEPLLWFGIYAAPEPWQMPDADGSEAPRFSFAPWQADISGEDYVVCIAAIRERIAAGDTYQVNFSYMLESHFTGDAEAMFAPLWRAQRGGYGALLSAEGRTIASFSPELFFEQHGSSVLTRPMKGTMPRGRWEAEDEAASQRLAASPKNRAENVMIVDLLRNDVGRIARPGSVAAEPLFEVQRYPTLWQMTSTVRAETDAGPIETLRALFPCGSITGAPKISTMGIISELEQQPRGLYTGAIGWIGPERRAAFSVAIRTIEIEADGRARYGVGGGVTWGSTPEGEWAETRTKALLLLQTREPFELLETLRWSPGEGFVLLERHLHRMESSARYFGFRFNREQAIEQLETAASGFGQSNWRVRLTSGAAGEVRVESKPLPDRDPARQAKPWRVALAAQAVDSRDVFLFHKTTRRQVYEAALAQRPGCDEVILHNERGELTEGSFTNLVLELEGKRCTPPRESGLLAGTLREELLERGEIEERILTAEDLPKADRIWLINSVRGWVEAEITS